MENERLVERAIDALRAVYSDMSVDQATALGRLDQIMEEIEVMRETLILGIQHQKRIDVAEDDV